MAVTDAVSASGGAQTTPALFEDQPSHAHFDLPTNRCADRATLRRMLPQALQPPARVRVLLQLNRNTETDAGANSKNYVSPENSSSPFSSSNHATMAASTGSEALAMHPLRPIHPHRPIAVGPTG